MNQPVIRILVVDDESAIRRELSPTLLEVGFQVAEAARGEEALRLLRSGAFNAVLLDVDMPGIGGIETLRQIRSFAPRLPILMLAANDRDQEKLHAFDFGADDYVAKPFNTKELIARIRVAVRRERAPLWVEEKPIHIGEIRLEPEKRVVSKRGKRLRLTPKQFAVLHYLMMHAGKPIPHARLLKSVWGVEYGQEVEYLRTFVHSLRKKIEDDPANPVLLLTDPYVGYHFTDSPNVDSHRQIQM